MPTNLDLDDKLIEQAVKAGSHRTKKDAVNAALAEYVRRRKRLRILEMAGKVDYWPDHDHKAGRRKR